MDCRNCPYNMCFIQKYCHPEWLEYTQHHKTSKYISPSKTIFAEGDLVTGIYVICAGKVKVLLKTSEGKKNIIRIAGQGQVLGHRGFSEEMVYPISAETLVESEIAYITNEDFFKLIRSNNDLAFYMMIFFADELLRSEQKLKVHTLKSSQEKIAVALAMAIRAFGYKTKETKHIDLGMSLNDLANFATISYSTLSRVLDTLYKEKIIENIENELYVMDESALKDLAGIEI